DAHRRVGRLTTARPAAARVRGGVEPREAVIEEVDRGPVPDRAWARKTLPLPTRDVGAALVDLRLEAAVHLSDEVVRLRDVESAPQLLVGRVRPAEAQVLRDGALEEVRGLRHHREPRPERLKRALAHIDAV